MQSLSTERTLISVSIVSAIASGIASGSNFILENEPATDSAIAKKILPDDDVLSAISHKHVVLLSLKLTLDIACNELTKNSN